MRILISIFLFLLLFSGNTLYGQSDANTRFVLNGRITGRNAGKVVLWHHDKENETIMDTAVLKDGRFSFKGTVNRACEALLWMNPDKRNFQDSSVIHFILEPGNLSVLYKEKDRLHPVIVGSPAELEKQRWDKVKSPLISRQWQLYKTRDSLNAGPVGAQDHVLENIGEISRRIRALDIQYIYDHPHTYLSGYLLALQMSQIAVDSLQMLYSRLSAAVKKSSIGYLILSNLYPLTSDNDFRKANPLVDKDLDDRLRNFRSIYDLTLKDTGGNRIDLHFLKGKYTVIDFWASWCKLCLENIPALNKMIEKYKDDSVQFVSISLDKDITDWKRAILRYKGTGIQFSDTDGFEGLAALYCKAIYVPTYVIANPDGQIIRYRAPQATGPKLRNTIDSLINHELSEHKHLLTNN